MKTNNATTYFITEKPRLNTKEYNRIVSQASQNGLQVYEFFSEGKPYIFYHKRYCSLFLLVE